MTDALLIIAIALLVLRLVQAEHQHRETQDTLNALAEMLGEAIDTWRQGR